VNANGEVGDSDDELRSDALPGWPVGSDRPTNTKSRQVACQSFNACHGKGNYDELLVCSDIKGQAHTQQMHAHFFIMLVEDTRAFHR